MELVDKVAKYEVEAKKINDQSLKVLKISSIYTDPQVILNIISSARVPGVNIERYKMDFDNGVIDLTGTSKDRDSLLTFKDNLQKSPQVSSVNIPISNFEKVNNIEFTLSFGFGKEKKEIPKLEIK